MSTQVVLITGALTGIGRAVAIAFASSGAQVVAAGRHDDAGQELAGELRALGAEAEYVNADVRKEDDVRALVDAAVARFGRLDAAVNAAGTEGKPGPLSEQTAETYAATFDTNVLGTLLSVKHELRVMQAQGSGSIINISSTYGHQGAAGASIYVASKHAVEGMTKSVALETASSGVRVNAVAPGPVQTGMLDRFTGTPDRKAALLTTVPLARLGDPAEIAGAAVFLASDAASFITGEILNVDGGKSAG
jgi:NAD(P)-dependent dehydrogenase (short-subunit alcohol dehydrogenase family)